MIVGEYEQRAVNKRYNVVVNGLDSVLKTSVVFSKDNGIFYGRDEPSFCLHTLGYPANTKHLYDIYTTSAQRLRRWSKIV